jgi:small GTP-binding protein
MATTLVDLDIVEIEPPPPQQRVLNGVRSQEKSLVDDSNSVLIKIIITGQTGVGKTKLLESFRGLPYRDSGVATIGIDFIVKHYRVTADSLTQPLHARVQLWDTAGQERFSSMASFYCRGAHGMLVVYDLTDRASFECAERYFADAQEVAGTNMVCVLAGNKADLCPEQRRVATSEWQSWARERNVLGYETSAKTATDVNTAFTEIIRVAITRLVRQQYRGRGGSRIGGAHVPISLPLNTVKLLDPVDDSGRFTQDSGAITARGNGTSRSPRVVLKKATTGNCNC